MSLCLVVLFFSLLFQSENVEYLYTSDQNWLVKGLCWQICPSEVSSATQSLDYMYSKKCTFLYDSLSWEASRRTHVDWRAIFHNLTNRKIENWLIKSKQRRKSSPELWTQDWKHTWMISTRWPCSWTSAENLEHLASMLPTTAAMDGSDSEKLIGCVTPVPANIESQIEQRISN